MKKLTAILALALLLVAPAAMAQMAGSVISLNAATTNLTGIDARFGAYPALQVHVFWASAVCTVAIEIGSTLNNYQVVARCSTLRAAANGGLARALRSRGVA